MSYVLDRHRPYPTFGSTGRSPLVRDVPTSGVSGFDLALIVLFLLGLYTNYTIEISTKVPFPSAPSGIAGLILLWRRRNQITPRAFACLITILFLYVISILCASDVSFLPRRTNGLIQLTYSIVIGFALFLTITQATRRQIAILFLTFSLVVLIGCLLEDYGGLKPVSDSVREVIYRRGVYENDMRDMLLYKRIRPKFFASEPSSVTFCYSVFTFVWFVISRWRWKIVLYVAMVGLGIFAMPGPTLLLMLLLILPYMLFLRSRVAGRINGVRFMQALIVAVVFGVAFVILAQTIFSERLKEITSGNDPSFFYRVQGPALAAREVLKDYPFFGSGLTGEPFIQRQVVDLYVRSPAYSAHWTIVSPATELLINYFWLHWIYLGLIWGSLMVAAVSIWLVVLGVPSVAFCWMAWAILGQASGAYVGPTCWAVMFLMAAASILRERVDPPDQWSAGPVPAPLWQRSPAPVPPRPEPESLDHKERREPTLEFRRMARRPDDD
jgi:hypothetical protein